MSASEQEIEQWSRQRARAGVWMFAGFLAVLIGIAGNDFLVREGRTVSLQRTAMFALIAGGAALLIGSLLRLAIIIQRTRKDSAVRQKLWDELASSNHVHSMMLAYLAMLLVLVVLAVFSMFTSLSSPWVVNGLMLTGLGVQTVSFALLERRGDSPATQL